MFCKKCGAQIEDGSVICSGCGAELVEISEETAVPSAAIRGTRGAGVALKMSGIDWFAAGASIMLLISLFIPWVLARDYGGNEMFGANYGWLAIISALAIIIFLGLKLLPLEIPVPNAAVYVYFGGFALMVTTIMMAIRPFEYEGYLMTGGDISRYPFIGAGIALIASIAIIVCGILQYRGSGIHEEEYYHPGAEGMKTPEFIAGSSALLLFIALLMPWVSACYYGETALGGAGFGWIAIISVIAVALLILFEFLPFDLPITMSVILLVAGGLALLMVVLMMGIRPISLGYESLPQGTTKTPYFGAYMALYASAGILLAGYMKSKEV